jgi:hypothetical protein
MSRFKLYGVSVHTGQGAPQCKISTFLVEIVLASAPNVELRDSRTFLSHTPIVPYNARDPFVQNPKGANATE